MIEEFYRPSQIPTLPSQNSAEQEACRADPGPVEISIDRSQKGVAEFYRCEISSRILKARPENPGSDPNGKNAITIHGGECHSLISEDAEFNQHPNERAVGARVLRAPRRARVRQRDEREPADELFRRRAAREGGGRPLRRRRAGALRRHARDARALPARAVVVDRAPARAYQSASWHDRRGARADARGARAAAQGGHAAVRARALRRDATGGVRAARGA